MAGDFFQTDQNDLLLVYNILLQLSVSFSPKFSSFSCFHAIDINILTY
jgi:hypothetical protein